MYETNLISKYRAIILNRIIELRRKQSLVDSFFYLLLIITVFHIDNRISQIDTLQFHNILNDYLSLSMLRFSVNYFLRFVIAYYNILIYFQTDVRNKNNIIIENLLQFKFKIFIHNII